MSDEPDERTGSGRGRLVGGGLAVLAVVAVLTLLLVGLLQGGVETTIQDALDAGERPPAPSLALPVLAGGDSLTEGEIIDVPDLAGRPVVINFWASWCPPCRSEAPLLEDISRRYADEVLFLGVDSRDLSDNARAFIAEFGLTYPSLRDGTDATERRWELTGLPETYILDDQGRVAARIVGEITRAEQITTPLDQLL